MDVRSNEIDTQEKTTQNRGIEDKIGRKETIRRGELREVIGLPFINIIISQLS